jgi:hypothetical protein
MPLTEFCLKLFEWRYTSSFDVSPSPLDPFECIERIHPIDERPEGGGILHQKPGFVDN